MVAIELPVVVEPAELVDGVGELLVVSLPVDAVFTESIYRQIIARYRLQLKHTIKLESANI